MFKNIDELLLFNFVTDSILNAVFLWRNIEFPNKHHIMNALEVSQYLIAKFDNVGDFVTNKKLNKVLYYVKAWGLVFFPDGVIDEPFEAWIHGPVCVPVYQQYKIFGYNPIRQEYKNGISSSQFINNFKQGLPSEELNKVSLIDAVFNKYAQLSSLQLELLTHSEKPWIEAREGLSPIETGKVEIKESTMKEFYSSKN